MSNPSLSPLQLFNCLFWFFSYFPPSPPPPANSSQVALHACGIATDMVIEHCVQAGAAFVISPCCYGFIQNAIKFTFPKRFVHLPVAAASPLPGFASL